MERVRQGDIYRLNVRVAQQFLVRAVSSIGLPASGRLERVVEVTARHCHNSAVDGMLDRGSYGAARDIGHTEDPPANGGSLHNRGQLETGSTASAAISTSAPAPNWTPTVARAGRGSRNNEPYAESNAGSSLMSLRKHEFWITSSRDAPPARRTASTFLMAWRVCSSTPSAKRPVEGSDPSCPATARIPPARSPCEKEPPGVGA